MLIWHVITKRPYIERHTHIEGEKESNFGATNNIDYEI